MLRIACFLLATVAPLALLAPAQAQQNEPAKTDQAETIKRTPLQRFDVPGTGYEAVIGIAEIAPNVLIGRHTHPGPESGYVLAGSFTLFIDGEEPREVKAGESYKVPPRVVHDARTGADGATVIATYVVEKGEPLATSAQ